LKNKERLLSLREQKEYSVFNYLYLNEKWQQVSELERVLGYGERVITESIRRLKKRIFQYGLEGELRIEKRTHPISYKLIFRKQIYARQFIHDFFIHSDGYKLFNEGFQHPEVSLVEVCQRLNISKGTAKLVREENSYDLADYDLYMSQRGFEVYGSEENIREMLFHFWWDFTKDVKWPLFEITRKEAEEFTRELLDVFEIEHVDNYSFRRLCLRVGITLMRTKRDSYYTKSTYMKNYFSIDKEIQLRLYSLFSSHEPSRPESELRYLIFILLSEVFIEDVFIKCVHNKKITEASDCFIKELVFYYPNLPQATQDAIRKRSFSLLFRLSVLEKAAIAHPNISYFNKAYPKLFNSTSRLSAKLLAILGIEGIRPIYLGASLIDLLKDVFIDEKKRVKIFIDKQIDFHVRNTMRKELERNFARYFHLSFAQTIDEKDVDLVLSAEEFYPAGQSTVIRVNERLSYYDCTKIEGHIEELDKDFGLGRFA